MGDTPPPQPMATETTPLLGNNPPPLLGVNSGTPSSWASPYAAARFHGSVSTKRATAAGEAVLGLAEEPSVDNEFVDWVEDERWRVVGHAKTLRRLRGTFAPLWYRAQGWMVVMIVGVLVGTVGAMIHISALWVHGLTRGLCPDYWWLPQLYCDQYSGTDFQLWPSLMGLQGTSWAPHVESLLFIVISCALTTTAALLVYSIAPIAAGAGIPEIKAILGGARIANFAGLDVLLVKWVGLLLAFGGSLSIGKAAPVVHIAFCIGNIVACRFEKYRQSLGKKREMLTAATAAGVCVAFGAPLGGVLYAFEETSSFFTAQTLYRSFLCSVVAGATLQAWDPFLSGRLTLFAINYHVPWELWELPCFLLVGVAGGITGHLFNKTHLAWAKNRASNRLTHPVLEVVLVTLLTCGITLIAVPATWHRTDAEYLQLLFQHCSASDVSRCPITPSRALTIGILKFFLTSMSFGMMVPAGLFMPNLVLGGCLGWLMGNAFNYLAMNSFLISQCSSMDVADCVVPSIYALVGAAAVMAGVNRMTISIVTIMFELTGGLEYIIPVTLGVMASKWMAELLGGKDSIYNKLMDVKGLPFLDPRFEGQLEAPVSVKECMSFDPEKVPVLFAEQPLGKIGEALRTDATGFPVLNNSTDKKVVGFISRRQLSHALLDLARELQASHTKARADVQVYLKEPRDMATPPGTPYRTPLCLTPGVHTPGLQKMAYDLHGYVDHSPVTVTSDVDLARVVLLFRRLGLQSLLVVDENNHLLGIMSKIEVIEYLQEHQSARRLREALQGGQDKDAPHGGFHQSELEGEDNVDEERLSRELRRCPSLPPEATILKRRVRKPTEL